MNRWLSILILLVAGCVSEPTAKPNAVPGAPFAAAQLYHGDSPAISIPVNAQPSPQTKAAALLRTFPLAQPGDLILVGFGIYDFGNQAITFPPGVTIRGMGRGLTIFKSNWFDWDGNARIAFKLSNGSVIEDLTLSQTSLDPKILDPTVDAICCGFAQPNLSATLRRIDITGRDWSLYCWQPDCSLTVENFTITGGRVCVAAEDSGNGQSFTLRHGTIIGDASLSQCSPSYDVSNPNNGGVFGLVSRGGPTLLDDVQFQIKGEATLPRAVAITDVGGDNGEPAGNTKITLLGCQIIVDPNGAPTSWDVDLQYDYTRSGFLPVSSLGSNLDKSLNKSW